MSHIIQWFIILYNHYFDAQIVLDLADRRLIKLAPVCLFSKQLGNMLTYMQACVYECAHTFICMCCVYMCVCILCVIHVCHSHMYLYDSVFVAHHKSLLAPSLPIPLCGVPPGRLCDGEKPGPLTPASAPLLRPRKHGRCFGSCSPVLVGRMPSESTLLLYPGV